MNKYLSYIRIGVADAMEYRLNFFLDLISSFFPIVVQYFLWTAVYRSALSDVINGYSYHKLIKYILAASLMARSIAPGFEDAVSVDIRMGGLNKYLVQPISYFGCTVSLAMGKKVINLLIAFSITLIAYYLLSAYWGNSVSVANVVWFIVVIMFSLVMNCGLHYCLSMVAFWLTQTWGVIIAFRVIVNILSGGVLPLNMLGSAFNAISTYLPFRYIIEFPVDVLQGNYTFPQIISGLCVQIVSSFVFIALSKLLWNAGQKRYMAIGG